MLGGRHKHDAPGMSKDLNPERALIFRITHRENIPLIFRDGLHCHSAAQASQVFVQIGNSELIARRQSRRVDCHPGGMLSDYIPFYFTPYSPMMYNIKTGYNGVQKRDREDIVILISSLHRLVSQGIPFVFSDRHAYLKLAIFSNDIDDLDQIDWASLQARKFTRDDADRFERYQAEALVHRHMPISALLGAVCYTEAVQQKVQPQAAEKGLQVKVLVQRQWYL